jgi:hypothetical protein
MIWVIIALIALSLPVLGGCVLCEVAELLKDVLKNNKKSV